jgi:alkylation response protein AidB-like acyl-CoA dehydrogenase
MYSDLLTRVRAFVDDELLPAAHARAESGEFAEDIVQRMRELGLFGTLIPREYGGLGLSLEEHVQLTEEVARGWLSMAGVLNPHTLCSHILVQSGTAEQRAELLPRMASGELRAAFSLTEPHAGSDVASIRTAATRTADGHWEISGRKRWITNGLGAGVVFVLAITDPEVAPAKGGATCFITEKQPWAWKNEDRWEGVEISEAIEKMGDLGVETTDLVYSGYRCAPSRVLGGEGGVGRGFVQMIAGMEAGRVGASSLCVGVAQRCLDVAMHYSLQRTAFGKPIAEHQAITFKLADMATKVEAARLMTRHAAQQKDRGERSDLQAGMAKLLATENAVEVAEDAFRIHGSAGYDKNSEVERLYRDALSLVSAEGPSEIQRLVIGRGLIRAARARRDADRPPAANSAPASLPPHLTTTQPARRLRDESKLNEDAPVHDAPDVASALEGKHAP